MKEYNLLELPKTAKRDLSVRKDVSFSERLKSSKFGYDYFDGGRRLGYGGYNYDGRWVKVSKRAVEFFDLKPGDKVLDVGCGKGFFVHDLVNSEGLDAYGVDVSSYAISKAMPDIVGRLHLQDMRQLLFPDGTFDAVFCINTLHNLSEVEAFSAMQELNRVVKDKRKIFVQVDSYRNEEDLKVFEHWVLTAKLYMNPEKWLEFFEKCSFQGAFYWTVLRADGSVE